MELNICVLYPSLLNMHADSGNAAILKFRAESRGIKTNITSFNPGDYFSPSKYDIIILGGAQGEKVLTALDDLKKNIKYLKEYIEDEGVMLAVGTGFQCLGEYFFTESGHQVDGCNILPVYTEEAGKTFTGNISVKIDNEICVGFENHFGRTYLKGIPPLSSVLKGFGNNGEDKTEGARYKNLLCTYMHGPFLAKNPSVADEMIRTVIDKKYENVPSFDPLDDEFERAAKRIILKKLNK